MSLYGNSQTVSCIYKYPLSLRLHVNHFIQYTVGTLRRELNKAYCGYMTSDLHPTPSGQSMAVATGNWGCGAFGGNPRYMIIYCTCYFEA